MLLIKILVKNYGNQFLKNILLFLFMFVQGVIESIISNLTEISRDYRYISYILHEEKRTYKKIILNQSKYVIKKFFFLNLIFILF